MAARLLRVCGRAAGLCPRRGCGEAAGLRAMGFSQEQARRLLGVEPRLGPQRREAAVAQLLLLGLNAEAALGLLERSPGLLRMPKEQLQERAGELRRLGLDGGQLQRAVSRCPELFTLPRKRMAAAVRLLRERCLLTAEQLREVLWTCPNVLLEEPHQLHHHFQVRGAATGHASAAWCVPGPGERETPRPARSTCTSGWESSRRRL